MTPEELALIEIYRKAQEELLRIITQKAAKGTPAVFQRTMLKEITAEIAKLTKESVSWAKQNIPAEYRHWQKEYESALANWFEYAKANNIPLYKMSQADITVLHSNAIKLITDDRIVRLKVANASLQRSIKKVLTQKIATGETVQQTKKRIIEEIYGTNGDGRIEINGRTYDPARYAETVARTATAEISNTVALNEGKAVGSDLIKMTSHAPTCSICAPLQGRVFTTNPERTDYPYIYDTAWRKGYNTVHPNCSHRFNTFIEELQTPKELEAIKKHSNRPIKESLQGKKQFERYMKNQRDQAERWRTTQQHSRYRARLGDEVVPGLNDFAKMKSDDGEYYQLLKLDYERQGRLIKEPELALPNAEHAHAAAQKFTHYLFNPDNPGGYAKGVAITHRLGYNISNWELLQKEIIAGSTKYSATFKGNNGRLDRYEQRMVLYGLQGTPANVIIGWGVTPDETKLVTAYIKEV